MTEAEKKATIKEFNFGKGVLVATFSGIMSASFALGLDAAAPISDISAQHGTAAIWTGLPKLCIVLLGGFTSNFIWCAILNVRNRTGYQYFSSRIRAEPPKREEETIIETALDAPSEEVVEHSARSNPGPNNRVPVASNYFFSALAGTTWYMQFFFYTMGESQMGNFKFSSWTLHMASIIIFSSLWGIALREWKGSSGFTRGLLALGLFMLVFSTFIVGFGNYLAAK